jgi:hypothetical protein
VKNTESFKPIRWHDSTSWEQLPVTELPNGVRYRSFRIGSPDSTDAPTVFQTYYPPHIVIATHTHDCDYAEIIVDGSVEVARIWYRAGEIRTVQAGTAYGPLRAGPEGTTLLIVFKSSNWAPIPTREDDVEGMYLEQLSPLC